MSGLLYYRPGPEQLACEELAELGIAYAFEKRQPGLRVTTRGPDDKTGVVICDPDRMDKQAIGYYKEEQEWRQVADSKLWVGWYREGFSPSSLLRENALPGSNLVLGDDQKWQVPLLRQWDILQGSAFCQLPSVMKHDGKGWQFGGVKAEYAEIWKTAEQYWSSLMNAVFDHDAESSEEVIDFSFSGFADFAVTILSLNYVISPLEISALELFVSTTPQAIVDTAVDWPTFEGWLVKKNEEEPAGDTTSDGDKA